MAGPGGQPRVPPTFSPAEQSARLTRLEALEKAIGQGSIKEDPDGLAPERIVVFETNAPVQHILRAAKEAGFPYFEELEFDVEGEDADGRDPRIARAALYVGLPNEDACASLVRAYRTWKASQQQQRKQAPFNELFERLVDVRPWGPRDRLTDADLEVFRAALRQRPNDPVLVEVELWPTRPRRDPAKVIAAARSMGATIVDNVDIDEYGFGYRGLLVEVPAHGAVDLIEGLRDGPIGHAEDVYSITPASTGQTPALPPTRASEGGPRPPLDAAAQVLGVLLDGAVVANHPLLRGGVVEEPMFDHNPSVEARRHATAMASIVLRGDLNANDAPLPARLLSIPLLQDRDGIATSNPRKLFVDQVHRALRRAFTGDEQGAAAAPGAFVVNLSLGVADRVFANRASALARLLDWWSGRYGVLFVIAAGNTTERLIVPDIEAIAFEELDSAARARRTALAMVDAAPSRALLAPAECVNGLTVGASAWAQSAKQDRGGAMFHPFDGRDDPSIISRTGFGARGSLKPDVLAPGGRPRARIVPAGDATGLVPQDVFLTEDCLMAAAPARSPIESGTSPTFGTSPAAAAVTRMAIQAVLALERDDGAFPDGLDRRDRALAAKALISHSARWGVLAEYVCEAVKARAPQLRWQAQRSCAARLLGRGAADEVRAVSSDDHRATCVGFGRVERDNGVIFSVPIPDTLHTLVGPRRLLITLSWFSPVTPWRSKQPLARLQADIMDTAKLSEGAATLLGADTASLGPPPSFGMRSSVWSASYGGDKPVPIGADQSIEVRVSCFADPIINKPVPFAVAVTIEAEAGVAIYAPMAARLRLRERVGTRA